MYMREVTSNVGSKCIPITLKILQLETLWFD